MFCPGKTVCRYGTLYVFMSCNRACVCGCDGDVISVGHDLNWHSGCSKSAV